MDVDDAGQRSNSPPAAAEGVLFDGMTADGSKVFFSSAEHLTGEDNSTQRRRHLHLGSRPTRSPSSPRARRRTRQAPATPSANTVHAHWNTTGSEENCGDARGRRRRRVASEDGTIYFLSPEQLDGSANGTAQRPQPLPRPPRGHAPHFVATLESTAQRPLPPKVHPFLRAFGAFANPTGLAIAEAPGEEGDSYVLDVSRGFGGTVEKFDSSGNLV